MVIDVRLLIVEDDQTQVALWTETIELRNADPQTHGVRLIATFADSAASAQAMLFTHRFDAAVVDLRLRREHEAGGHNADGNNGVRMLAESELTTVAVLTGQPKEYTEGDAFPHIRVFTRGGDLSEVLAWITEQSEFIGTMSRVRHLLGNKMANLFHASLWPRWRLWAAEKSELEVGLARHMAAHLHHSLLPQEAELSHPEEAYFVPPMSRRIETGDLIELEGKVHMIITPRCDLATAKARSIQLAECEDAGALWEEALKKGRGRIADLKQHDKKARQHFIPRMTRSDGAVLGPWMVAFDRIQTLPLDQLANLETRRFASLTPHFLPALVERLGSYFSRIGAPDL